MSEWTSGSINLLNLAQREFVGLSTAHFDGCHEKIYFIDFSLFLKLISKLKSTLNCSVISEKAEALIFSYLSILVG